MQAEGQVGMLGDEVSDDVMNRRWGPLIVAALAYVAVGAWDWTDTVEALARSATLECLLWQALFIMCPTSTGDMQQTLQPEGYSMANPASTVHLAR